MSFQGKVVVYSTSACPHCKAAKNFLSSLQVPFINVDVEKYPEQREYVQELAKKTSVPQIFFNERHVGGNSELQNMPKDELKELIEHVKNTPSPPNAPQVPDALLWLGQVTVFSLEGCESCLRVIKLLDERKIPYEKIDLSLYPEFQDRMVEASGRTSVPQIFFNDKFVGGLKDITQMIKNGTFENVVQECRITPYVPFTGTTGYSLVKDDTENYTRTQCETDEFSSLIKIMRTPQTGLKIGSNYYHLKKYPKCFVANEFIDWCIANGTVTNCKTRADAVVLGQTLIDRKVIIHVVEDDKLFADKFLFFRFLQDNTQALNGKTSECRPGNPSVLCKDIRVIISQLYANYVDETGFCNFKGLERDSVFADYCELATRLQKVDLGPLTEDERLAFFLNIYNALVIHGKVVYGAPKGVLARGKFFDGTSYIIDGEEYSLNEIEHGIIRSNTKPPGLVASKLFGKSDPRLKYVIPKLDPRIHFALNCGAKSCPPVKSYTPERLDKQLTLATKAFLEDECTVEGNTVSLSMLFKWYSSDFGATDKLKLTWISLYCDAEKKEKLEKLIVNESFKIKYNNYDWNGEDSRK